MIKLIINDPFHTRPRYAGPIEPREGMLLKVVSVKELDQPLAYEVVYQVEANLAHGFSDSRDWDGPKPGVAAP